MKWLKFEQNEKRDKVLTVRISADSYSKLKAIIAHVKSKQSKSISQADLIENLIDVAHSEIPTARTKK